MLEVFFQEERFFPTSPKFGFLPRFLWPRYSWIWNAKQQLLPRSKVISRNLTTRKSPRRLLHEKWEFLGFVDWFWHPFWLMQYLNPPQKKLSRESNIKSNQPAWTDHLAALLWIPAPKNSDAKWMSSPQMTLFAALPVLKKPSASIPQTQHSYTPKV